MKPSLPNRGFEAKFFTVASRPVIQSVLAVPLNRSAHRLFDQGLMCFLSSSSSSCSSSASSSAPEAALVAPEAALAAPCCVLCSARRQIFGPCSCCLGITPQCCDWISAADRLWQVVSSFCPLALELSSLERSCMARISVPLISLFVDCRGYQFAFEPFLSCCSF